MNKYELSVTGEFREKIWQPFLDGIKKYELSANTTCLVRLMLPEADIRCAAGREVYFAGQEKTLFRIVDSIFAEGYLTAGGQSIDETFKVIREAGFSPFKDAE